MRISSENLRKLLVLFDYTLIYLHKKTKEILQVPIKDWKKFIIKLQFLCKYRTLMTANIDRIVNICYHIFCKYASLIWYKSTSYRIWDRYCRNHRISSKNYVSHNQRWNPVNDSHVQSNKMNNWRPQSASMLRYFRKTSNIDSRGSRWEIIITNDTNKANTIKNMSSKTLITIVILFEKIRTTNNRKHRQITMPIAIVISSKHSSPVYFFVFVCRKWDDHSSEWQQSFLVTERHVFFFLCHT